MSSQPLDSISLGGRLRLLAAEADHADAVRFVAPGGRVTASLSHAELNRRSDAVATALLDRGVGTGDRVTFALPNHPAFTDAVLGTWKVGATPIPIRWDIPDWELERIRATAQAAVHLDQADVEAMAAGPIGAVPDAVPPIAWGICSSGSTGTPKIILTTRSGVWHDAYGMEIIELWRPLPRPQTLLVPAPLYHANAFTTLNNLLAGDRLVVLTRFDEATVLTAVEQFGVNAFRATPTMLQRIADHPAADTTDWSGLHHVVQGAAPMPPSLAQRWIELVGGDQLLMAYGMTEGLGVTGLLGSEWLEHPGSVGRGIRGTKVSIRDDQGSPVPAGTIGDVYLRTPSGANHRYLGADALDPTDDGFRTVGDLGHVDPDGYLYLSDRRVDMIVTGGANVFPAEVEAALIDHPGVADIVVVGLRDDRWGRRVHAIVEPSSHHDRPTEGEIIAHARERLSPYKLPKTVEFVDRLPRTEATKINRRTLVDERGG